MTSSYTEIRTLLTKGLYGDNLSVLLSLVRKSFSENPTLYGTFIFVFEKLATEFGEQGLPTSRYEHINRQISQPLLDALDAHSASPQQLLNKLNVLHEALFAL